MKKVFVIIATLIIFAGIFNIAYSAGTPVEVFVDGTKVKFTPDITIRDGYIYVPLDNICDALGADIINKKNGKNDVFLITKIKTNRILEMESGLKTIKANSYPVELKYEPILIGSLGESQRYIYVNLSLIVERLGGEAIWNKETNKVQVNSKVPIKIKDSNLDLEIRSQFKIPKGEMYKGDVKSIETLIVNNKNIFDINGLEYFESLTNLDISNNQIRDIMPIRQLKNLSVLLIKGNPIEDYSPTSLYYNKLIKDFNITIKFNDKKIEEAVVAAAGKKAEELKLDDLFKIKALDLSGKNISDLQGIQYLSYITELDISDNSINNIRLLENLVNLNKLSLASNQVSDISALGYYTNLEILYLDENEVYDLSPVSKCTNLKQLSAAGNKVADISKLAGLASIETLDLSQNKINDIKGLEKLLNIKELYLNNNAITDLSPVTSLSKLEVLDLSANSTGKITGIEKLKNLKALYISENGISDIQVLGNLTGLQVLDLAYNGVSKIDSLSKLVNLTTLYLKGNKIIDYSPLIVCSKIKDKDYGNNLGANGSIIQRFTIGKNNYTINGEERKMDTSPLIKGGRTFLPIRYVSETVGATVGWDEKEKKVTVTSGSNTVVLWLNKDVAMINGSLKKIDAAPFLSQNRTLLPIRFVGESLGLNVKWDPDKKEVILYNAAYINNQ